MIVIINISISTMVIIIIMSRRNPAFTGYKYFLLKNAYIGQLTNISFPDFKLVFRISIYLLNVFWAKARSCLGT